MTDTVHRVDPKTGLEYEIRPGEAAWEAKRRFDREQEEVATRDAGRAVGLTDDTGATAAGFEYKTVRVAFRHKAAKHARDLTAAAAGGWELVDVKSGGLFSGKDIATFKRVKR